MNQPATALLPPVEKTIQVPLDIEAAFKLFTERLGEWWPLQTHSVAQQHAASCTMELRVGGRLFERTDTGEEHEWGIVQAFDPPDAIRFSWYPGRTAETEQLVDVRFAPIAEGTELTLIHSGWECLGERAAELREQYQTGWDYVLGFWQQAAA